MRTITRVDGESKSSMPLLVHTDTIITPLLRDSPSRSIREVHQRQVRYYDGFALPGWAEDRLEDGTGAQ